MKAAWSACSSQWAFLACSCSTLVVALLQARYIRQMAEVLRVIQSIPHQKLVRGIETHELRLVLEAFGDSLVQERANLERARLPIGQNAHQTIESPPRIHNVLDQTDILSL